jgi:acyl dehydratase
MSEANKAEAEAEDHPFDALQVGGERVIEYPLDRSIAEAFARLFGDRSPIHVDRDYARAQGYPDVVVHGAVLNGLLSHFIGMALPGRRALILSTELRFLRAVHPGDTVVCRGQITQRVESQHAIELRLGFVAKERGIKVASGRAQVRVRDG